MTFGTFFSPIPQLFWSVYESGPFVRCIHCEVPLLEANAYVVQKRMVGDESVFEMALCERCCGGIQYSEETKEKITEYMAKFFEHRAVKLLESSDGPHVIDVSEVEDEETGQAMTRECLDYCLICRTPRSECHRYSATAHCRLQELIAQISPVSRTPLMVCDKCELGMAELISKETRDSWDRFVEEHFDGPPGIELDSPCSYPIAF